MHTACLPASAVTLALNITVFECTPVSEFNKSTTNPAHPVYFLIEDVGPIVCRTYEKLKFHHGLLNYQTSMLPTFNDTSSCGRTGFHQN